MDHLPMLLPFVRAISICFASWFLLLNGSLPAQESLMPLRYNHPGLVVDLGVGLWAWPVPCDADGDGDYDLLVSCPDKPSNGVWFFENTTGDTSKHTMPVFKPGRMLSKTTHYVMPSYVGGDLRVLSPGFEYSNFNKTGTEEKIVLPIDARFHKPLGTQPKGPKVRHNQWRYVDYDGDGNLDLIVAVEDWSYYGWDDAWNEVGQWQNGPLHGWIYVFRNRGTPQQPDYAAPEFVEADGKRLDVFGCPSPNFEDWDGDGDLDLICGEFIDQFTYFENLGTRTAPKYGAGHRVETIDGERLAMELEMIVPIAFDWDRDGDPDLIVGDEDGIRPRFELITVVTHAGHQLQRLAELPFVLHEHAPFAHVSVGEIANWKRIRADHCAGHAGGDQQDQHQRLGELAQELAPFRHASARGQLVGPVGQASGFHLFGGQALGGIHLQQTGGGGAIEGVQGSGGIGHVSFYRIAGGRARATGWFSPGWVNANAWEVL